MGRLRAISIRKEKLIENIHKILHSGTTSQFSIKNTFLCGKEGEERSREMRTILCYMNVMENEFE